MGEQSARCHPLLGYRRAAFDQQRSGTEGMPTFGQADNVSPPGAIRVPSRVWMAEPTWQQIPEENLKGCAGRCPGSMQDQEVWQPQRKFWSTM